MAFPFVRDLDTPLLEIGPNTRICARQFFEGIHIWGGIGSGKTSGSGKAVATALLRAGFGGITCVAKFEEVERWRDLAKKNGRSNSVIIFDENHGYNFIQHELARQGTRGLANVVECLIRLLEMAANATGTAGRDSEAFWLESIRELLNHIIPLLYSAYGTVTVSSILDFVTTAATKPELYTDSDWVNAHYAGRTMSRVVKSPVVPLPPDIRDAMLAYWIREYTAIPEKTRGNMVISLSSKLDRFRHGRLASCFCGKTDIVPEMTFHGAIIILAMPALTWNDDGIIGQQLFKYMWQRTVEARNGLEPSQRERGVYCYADESQYFANTYDDSFLSTCRGSRAAVIYLSQTLPAYYAKFGKDKSDAADGLVGKFATQIFHNNACPKTNQYASSLVGRGIHHRATQNKSEGWNSSRGKSSGANTGSGSSSGSSYGNASIGHNTGSNTSRGSNWGDNIGEGRNEGTSYGTSETMDNLVEPRFFATGLKTGGPAHGGLVTALWFSAGRRFAAAHGDNAMVVTFRQ
jgi:hypothetical protein